MTKITFALTAALLAGTTLTQAANARGIRVGFGFPLGSFVAHPTQSYADDGYGYGRHCDRKRYVHRSYHADAVPARKVKRHRKIDVAESKQAPKAPAIKSVKLESKLESNPATTTEIAKTNSNANDGNSTALPTTTASITPAATETAKTETIAAAAKTSTDEKADLKTVATTAKQICRRYSAAIAALVDVPCNE